MKFFYSFFNKTALYLAVEKENYSIVKILSKRPEIDPNIVCIFNHFQFQIKF